MLASSDAHWYSAINLALLPNGAVLPLPLTSTSLCNRPFQLSACVQVIVCVRRAMLLFVVTVFVCELTACIAAPGQTIELNDVSTWRLFNRAFTVMSLHQLNCSVILYHGLYKIRTYFATLHVWMCRVCLLPADTNLLLQCYLECAEL
jgi:hypothetical protein